MCLKLLLLFKWKYLESRIMVWGREGTLRESYPHVTEEETEARVGGPRPQRVSSGMGGRKRCQVPGLPSSPW